jgi:hypothetical protein
MELAPLISDLSRECSAGLTNPGHTDISVRDTCDMLVYLQHAILHTCRNIQTMKTLINSTYLDELVWFLGVT